MIASMTENAGVAGQVCVSENFKQQLELEAPNEVKYTYHDTIHFMSLAKESNSMKVHPEYVLHFLQKLESYHMVMKQLHYFIKLCTIFYSNYNEVYLTEPNNFSSWLKY